MLIRTQVYCFVLFLAFVLTSTLLHRQLRGDTAVTPVTPETASDPSPFYSAVSQHFQVPPSQLRQLADAGLPPSEVVVLCYIARHSLAQPTRLLADRRNGRSWRDIATASGLEPASFYYPISYSRGPFVNVFAVYHRVPRDRWTWNELQLTDSDIENLVNLRFLAESGGRSVPDVQQLRAKGYDYVSIHHFLLAGQKTAQLGDAPPARSEAS